MTGIKHMVECHCVLPQFRNRPSPPFHKFVVFSTIDDGDTVIEKHAKCNNCGVVHNVYDISKSHILSGQEEGAVMEISDFELMMPKSLANILQNYSCDLPTWENVLFNIQNDVWNSKIVLSKKSEDGITSGRILKMIAPGNYQIQPYSAKDLL